MRKTITIIPVLALSLILLSCSKLSSSFDTIEKTIGSDPEKAVELLDEVRPEVRSKHDRARYALLKSLAMDALWIDYESDSLTSVALDYYKDHGSADEKLKAYFLHAMYYDNIGERETEMEYLVQAEDFVQEADAPVISGRLYATESSIFYERHDTMRALDYIKRSVEQLRISKDTTRLAEGLIRLSDNYCQANDPVQTLFYLKEAGELLDVMDQQLLDSYYASVLIYERYYGNDVPSAIESYFKNSKDGSISWRHVSSAYYASGEYAKAIDALNKYEDANAKFKNDPAYYSLKANIYSAMGQFRNAYQAELKYNDLCDSLNQARYHEDTRFLKERHDKDMMIANAKSRILIISLITVLVFVCLASLSMVFIRKIRRHRKERLEMKNILDSTNKKNENLEQVVAELEDWNGNVKKLMKEETLRLHSILSRYINKGNDGDDVEKAILNALGEPGSFQKSLRMMYDVLYPDFIAFLEENGLDEDEIEMSCLYCMGLTGQGIRKYTKNSRAYPDSCEIRKKLGLDEHGTNIAIFLRAKLNAQYPDTVLK